MKRGKAWVERIVDRMEQMDEPMLLQPIVELVSDRRVLIENHGGVLQYTDEEIIVKLRFGNLVISGSNMKICRMQGQLLVITGKIDQLTMERGRG